MTIVSFSEPHCLPTALASRKRWHSAWLWVAAVIALHRAARHPRPGIPADRGVPEEPFETCRWFTQWVKRFSRVTVRTNRYSVSARLIGRQIRVLLHASHLVVYDGNAEVARHERLPAKSTARLDLGHYLEARVRKPGALPGSTALEQAGRFRAEPVLVRIDEPD